MEVDIQMSNASESSNGSVNDRTIITTNLMEIYYVP